MCWVEEGIELLTKAVDRIVLRLALLIPQLPLTNQGSRVAACDCPSGGRGNSSSEQEECESSRSPWGSLM